MSIVAQLIEEIGSFCEAAGIAETTFGRRAVNDGKFVGRIREGADVNVSTVDRVRAYIVAERQRMDGGQRPQVAANTQTQRNGSRAGATAPARKSTDRRAASRG